MSLSATPSRTDTPTVPSTLTPTLMTAKRALRSTIKSQLFTLPPEAIKSQSHTCLQTLLSLPEYAGASCLSVFLSMPSREIDTSWLVEHSLSTGKHVFVPYIHRQNMGHAVSSLASSASAPPSLMDMLALSSLDDYRALQPDSWGIPTIPKDSIAMRRDALKDEEPLDLIVMPGVAFDETFKRLGHGKGYYDYFLTRYHESRQLGKMPVLVAVALREQLLAGEAVPVGVGDWLVDIIVTGDGRCLRREN